MAFRYAGQGSSNLGPLTGFQRPARMFIYLSRWSYFFLVVKKIKV
jgi:hypothetical protein